MSARLLSAVDFMIRSHGEQVRKYTGEMYLHHPLEVAALVAGRGYPEDVVIAALFHDLIEDTEVVYEKIALEFGSKVADLVLEVTDVSKPENGNRAYRKALDKDHLAKSSPEGATIKLADLISNTKSIVKHDGNFAKVYLKEKAELLKVLTHGDSMLYKKAFDQIGE